MHRGRTTVLVVQDDSAVRDNVVNWLSSAGYSCLVTDNVGTALGYLRRLSPAITLVDVDDRIRLKFATFLASTPGSTTLVLSSSAPAARSFPPLPCCHLVQPCSATELLGVVNTAQLMEASYSTKAACS
jgi:hypothetical protein